MQLAAQDNFQEIELSNGSTFLLGEIQIENLKNSPYGEWFSENYNNYMVDKDLVKLFKKKLKRHEVLLFLGTWCGDSKREVPRLAKILDEANFPVEKQRIVALDRRKENYKKGANGEEIGWDIKRVPTLILLKDGKEINRIVERPVGTLEEDLLAILSNSAYRPNYSD